MKNIGMMIMGLLVWGLMSCKTGRVVQTEAAHGFALGQYQTFAMAEPEGPHGLRPYELSDSGELLQRRVVRQLEKRGLRHDPANPDLLVKIHVTVEDKVQTRETDIISNPPNYVGQQRFHWSVREVEVGRYKEGTVAVRLIDPIQDRVVWQGEGQRVLPKNIDRWEQAVAKGTEQVFSRL